MEIINFGVVGCGYVSKKHLQAIKKNPRAALIATCDNNKTRAHDAKAEFGAKRCYTNYKELLSDPEIDVVSICTPSGHHMKMAMLAARAGKHVVVEKPMALNVKDAETMVSEFKKTKRALSVILQNRCNEKILRLKKTIEVGVAGKVLLANATVRWYRPQSYYDNSWKGSRRWDGGTLMNQGIHYVDILLYLMNKKVRSVFCETSTLGHTMECEDVAIVTIRFDDESLGLIEVSTISYPLNLEGSLTVLCEKGCAKIGGTAMNKVELCTFSEPISQRGTSIARSEKSGHEKLINNMINHLLNGEKLIVGGAEGLQALRVIEASYQSAKTGRVVKL